MQGCIEKCLDKAPFEYGKYYWHSSSCYKQSGTKFPSNVSNLYHFNKELYIPKDPAKNMNYCEVSTYVTSYTLLAQLRLRHLTNLENDLARTFPACINTQMNPHIIMSHNWHLRPTHTTALASLHIWCCGLAEIPDPTAMSISMALTYLSGPCLALLQTLQWATSVVGDTHHLVHVFKNASSVQITSWVVFLTITLCYPFLHLSLPKTMPTECLNLGWHQASLIYYMLCLILINALSTEYYP